MNIHRFRISQGFSFKSYRSQALKSSPVLAHGIGGGNVASILDTDVDDLNPLYRIWLKDAAIHVARNGQTLCGLKQSRKHLQSVIFWHIPLKYQVSCSLCLEKSLAIQKQDVETYS